MRVNTAALRTLMEQNHEVGERGSSEWEALADALILAAPQLLDAYAAKGTVTFRLSARLNRKYTTTPVSITVASDDFVTIDLPVELTFGGEVAYEQSINSTNECFVPEPAAEHQHGRPGK